MRDYNGIRVLLAEDEQNLGAVLSQFLAARGCQVTTCGDGRAALDALRSAVFDVALLDVVMPELDGLEVLRQVREGVSAPEVIVITGNRTVETAVAAMELGAYDCLTKPYRMAEIELLVRRAWEKRRLARENALLRARFAGRELEPEIVTQYAPMRAVLSFMERLARTDSPVVISGEQGTGKRLAARVLHRLSERAEAPLVEVDCGAMRGEALESELFGCERGVLADVPEGKPGLFELASGGTILLGQIHALEPRLQAKLLRAMELGVFYRRGGDQRVYSDVRVIASTSEDLDQRMSEGTFRDDLYYRINTISVSLPPLRERAVDIPLIAQHFLARFGGAKAPVLSPDSVELLQGYAWPGNVRELRNVIERAVLLASEGVVRAGDLPLRSSTTPAVGREVQRAAVPLVSLDHMEQRHIEAVLRHVGWHQGRAAEILNISPKTLYRKIRHYGFRRPTGSS